MSFSAVSISAKFGTEQFKRALAGLIDERFVGKRERDSAPHHLLCPRTAVTLELYLRDRSVDGNP